MDKENHGFGLSTVCAQSAIVCTAKISTRKFSPSFLIALPSPHPSRHSAAGERPSPEAAIESGADRKTGYSVTVMVSLFDFTIFLSGSSATCRDN